MQPNLPIDLGPHSGFRLATLEILRWGTFDGDRFHRIDVGGFSGCVTGPNGGGKSTAVDALLTLLVPPDCRHYNVAASSEGKKKERTVKTYNKKGIDHHSSYCGDDYRKGKGATCPTHGGV